MPQGKQGPLLAQQARRAKVLSLRTIPHFLRGDLPLQIAAAESLRRRRSRLITVIDGKEGRIRGGLFRGSQTRRMMGAI